LAACGNQLHCHGDSLQQPEGYKGHWIIGFVIPETPTFTRGRFSNLAPQIVSLSVGI
jgi:hypothetical protein